MSPIWASRTFMGRAVVVLLVVLLSASCVPVPPPSAEVAPTPASQGLTAATQLPATEAPAPAETPVADMKPLLGNLGNHSRTVSTRSELAQKYFDEGLNLAYGFNHAEAIRSFKDALKLDPDCAMCNWGIAYALGPNINATMEAAAAPEAYAAVQKALELAPKATAVEQALIAAMAKRYGPEAVEDRAPLDKAFADAMREVVRQYPDDLDAAAIFAEALMDLTPWAYWTKDGQMTEHTQEIVSTLESILARNPNHPAANHYYIHAVEASQEPGRAIPSAERLADLVPGAGHLVHMPAHVYWRVGRYHDAYTTNEHAIHSDETYIPDAVAQNFYAVAYYPHNIHFLFAAAQMEGNSQAAIAAADKTSASIPDDIYLSVPPLEDFKPYPYYALVRFGKWEDILALPQPAEQFRVTTGAWHYARGMALTRLGRLDEAAQELAQLDAIASDKAMEALVLFSFAQASTILQMESHILAGELAAARGDMEEAIAQLKEAVRLHDGLGYIEPPAFYYPVRQTLGALLLKAGRAQEAEAVYREDLREYPENGWSLFGLAQSLEAQGKAEEAAEARTRFTEAWQHADVELAESRF